MDTRASNQTPSGWSDGFKAVWNQFSKDSDKLPGWVPLLVVTTVAVEWASPPDHISFFGRLLPVSREFLAAALTLLFYTVGDALDEGVFKTGPDEKRHTREIYEREYGREKAAASKALGVGAGLYQVALKLVTAGEKNRGTRFAIHLPNEAAKCLRALIVPLLLLAVSSLLQGWVVLAVTCMAGAVMFLTWYPMLKVHHIRRLYSAATDLRRQEKYGDWELGTIRFVFWDGNLVGSGRSAPPPAYLPIV